MRRAPRFALEAIAYVPWSRGAVVVENTGAPWLYTPSLRDLAWELAVLFRDERVLDGLTLANGVGGCAPAVGSRSVGQSVRYAEPTGLVDDPIVTH